jgi:hypothetical protein
VVRFDTDRRTVLAHHELPMADSAEQRAALAEVTQHLEGLDDRTRRKALLLVSALVVQGSMLSREIGETMRLRIDRFPDRLRIVASAGHDVLSVDFWNVVGGAAATAFADDWEIERDRSGAWFDIERVAS